MKLGEAVYKASQEKAQENTQENMQEEAQDANGGEQAKGKEEVLEAEFSEVDETATKSEDTKQETMDKNA